VGKERGRENLQSVIRQACEVAQITPNEIQHVCIGMAGASLAEAVHWAQQTIRELIPDSTIYVAGDHVIAHRAAFGTSPGVLVISGTGSIAFGRNQAGETARAGGWGPSVSDEGSAFWVGREALVEALRSFDLGKSNGLLSTIAAYWKVAPEEVIRMANASELRFPELAGPIVEAAEHGDAEARKIAEGAGKSLARLGSAVIQRLWPQGGVVPVALSGGVLQGSALVRQAFKDEMKVQQPQAAVSFAYVRPVLGALEIAAQRGVRR